MTRRSKFMLCIFCPKPEIRQFSKKPWFLLVGNSILIPQPGIRDIIMTVQPLFQGLFSKQSCKTKVTYMQVKINHELIFILLIKSRIAEISLNPLYLMFTSPSSTQRISILENTGNERSEIVHKYSFVLSYNRQMPVVEEQYQHYHQNQNYCKHLSSFFPCISSLGYIPLGNACKQCATGSLGIVLCMAIPPTECVFTLNFQRLIVSKNFISLLCKIY